MNIRQSNNNNRRRGRSNNRPQNGMRGNEQGSRIDNRARGNAVQLHEKYKNMARDVQMQGDRVMSEYYNQFADHYFRVLSEHRARLDEQQAQQRARYAQNDAQNEGGEDGPNDSGYDTGYDADDNDQANSFDPAAIATNTRDDDTLYGEQDDYGRDSAPDRDRSPRRDGNRDSNRDASRAENDRDGNTRDTNRRPQNTNRDTANRDNSRDTGSRDTNRNTSVRRDAPRDSGRDPQRQIGRDDRVRDTNRPRNDGQETPREAHYSPAREQAPLRKTTRAPRRPTTPEADEMAVIDFAVLPPALTPVLANAEPNTSVVSDDAAPLRKPRTRKPKADVATDV